MLAASNTARGAKLKFSKPAGKRSATFNSVSSTIPHVQQDCNWPSIRRVVRPLREDHRGIHAFPPTRPYCRFVRLRTTLEDAFDCASGRVGSVNAMRQPSGGVLQT